ncbi:MAG: lipoyl(octanoyl) transferase LipB [Chloroflexi bacterium]|nr:lipoyl(octanoyl) transferase LipB [Chloroflexota bacterium]
MGTIDYGMAWEMQKALAVARRASAIPDVLLLLEHPPTYTIGRSGGDDHLLLSEEALAERGARVFHVDRGGDITYHGPGQLVGYPILHLREDGLDVHAYLRNLEEVLIRALADLGLPARREPSYTGVWIDGEKIAAIGVKVATAVTSHGFALNVSTDLSYFESIVPCGIQGKGVTSIAKVLGRAVDMEAVVERVAAHFGPCLGLAPKPLLDARREPLNALGPGRLITLLAKPPRTPMGHRTG